MNTPIISPWFFYFAGIADGLGITLMVFGGIAILISTIILCGSLGDDDFTSFVKKKVSAFDSYLINDYKKYKFKESNI